MFLQLICTLCFLVGYRTKLNLVLIWIFVASFQSRNFLVGHGGDIVHRMYIFWAFFFPVGEYYSVDAALKPSNNPFISSKKKKDHMVLTGGTVGIFIFHLHF